TFTLNGGAVTGNRTDSYAGGILNYGTFNMTGGAISDNRATNGSDGVYVAGGDGTSGEFTMTGGTISGNVGRGVSVVGGTFTMEKGTISDNAGGVIVYNNGSFTMTGGTISGNTLSGPSGYGAGVHVVYGTFTMKGGTISGNKAKGSCGGGVYVSSTGSDKKGKFTMTGGTISGNAADDGGGVLVAEGGTFTMDDGCEISGNTATNGGGVQVAQGTFTMKGGAISGNTATDYNGGVGVYATFTMKGGTISNNTATNGGGVGLGEYGTIKLSGAVEISGNTTDGKDKNVVLLSEPKNIYNNSIVIEGTLSNQTPIGVSCGYEMTGPQVFTSGLPEYGAVGNFTSEQGDGYVILPVPQTISGAGAGEAVLYKRAKVTFDANGGKGTMEAQTVIQKWNWPLNANAFTRRGHSYSGWNTAADGSGTGYADRADIELTGDIALYAQWTRHPITVAAIPGQTYSGAAIKPAPVVRDQTTGETLAEGVDYAVTYTDNVNVGTATATVTGKGDYAGQVSKTFTIKKAALTVTAEAKSKTYGEDDPALTYTATGLVGSDKLTGALTRASGDNVGEYAIQQGTLAASGNYTLTYVGANLTINKKALTVTAEAKSKTYGEDDPTLTYTASGLVGSDKLTGALTRAAGHYVGSYAIQQGTLAASGNYTLTYVGANLTINKKAL
ncbi:MAG: InlB B-repeat-containing protein, partial [Clostridia bacterium]|nr:InlB B-repeat-containing protein [Clostridia bacterium]